MPQFQDYYHRPLSSIRDRLMLFFFILSAVPLLIVGIISYQKSFQSIEEISIESYSQVADQLNKSIELLFRDTEKYLTMGASDEAVEFLRQNEENEKLYKSAYNLILKQQEYREIFQFDNYIRGIYIIGLNGFALSERKGLYNFSSDFRNQNLIKEILKADGETVIYPHDLITYSPDNHREPVISLGRIIETPVTLETIGVIIVDIDQEAFQRLCEDLSIGNAGQFYVIAQNQKVLSPPDSYVSEKLLPLERINQIKEDKEGSFIAEVDGQDEFFVFNTLEKTNWKIIGRALRKDLMKSAFEIRTLSFWLIILNLTFFLFIYYLVSHAFTKPILNLKQVMREAELGNFDVRAHTKTQDEIADLCHSFNAMISKIKNLMQLTIEEHEELKKYELKALQAQINPHFLYNSLEAIIWMAEAGNKSDVVHITKNLSSFFRLSLSKGEEWISVKDEILHISHYLEIQKMRYRDILSYSIQVSEQLNDLVMLKIILQPLIENALYHGIKNKRSGGEISITAEKRGAWLHFFIKDNGAGMSEERLDEVKKALINQDVQIDSPGGFGMKNSYRRLKLFYSDDADLLITSREGEGTTVELIMPVKEALC